MAVIKKKKAKISTKKLDKKDVKVYKKRKRIKYRTRGKNPWWTELRSYKERSMRKLKKLVVSAVDNKKWSKSKLAWANSFLENWTDAHKLSLKSMSFKSKFKWKNDEYKRKFEFDRITKGFKKRRYYTGKYCKEIKNVAPIYLYATDQTFRVPIYEVPRYSYTNFFGKKARRFLIKKRGPWEKIVRPSIFFNQFYRMEKKMQKSQEKIASYKTAIEEDCDYRELIENYTWSNIDSNYPLVQFKKMWFKFVSHGNKRKKKKNFKRKWIEDENEVLQKELENELEEMIIIILEDFRRKEIERKKKEKEKRKEIAENLDNLLEVLSLWNDETADELLELLGIIMKKIERAAKIPKNKEEPKVKPKKPEQIFFSTSAISINLSNMLFHKIFHSFYNKKKSILSIYNTKNKYIFPRVKEYRIPGIFKYINKRFKTKIGVKNTINFYKEFPSVKDWDKELNEFFYVNFTVDKTKKYGDLKDLENKDLLIIKNLINHFQKNYYDWALCRNSTSYYWNIEELNKMKERNLEAYLSYTTTEKWNEDKNFFKIHREHGATRNRKYRKKAYRPSRKKSKKPKKVWFRTFFDKKSFRQRRFNTNWHNLNLKWGKIPISRFIWRHPLTKRYSKRHKIYRNKLKYISIDSDEWATNDWLGCIHYIRRKLKKRRKKIVTKIYFRKPKTSTVRDAKVNLAKGTIAYAKKTRTYHGRRIKVKGRWKKTRYRRYLKNTIKRWVFFSKYYKKK